MRDREVVDPWHESVRKYNQMVSMRLRSKAVSNNADGVNKPFVVGTYHMPCMFKTPAVMMIHCALSAQFLQKFAKKDPYLLLGDFNIKPESNMYRMLTEGEVEASNPELPVFPEDDDWRVKVNPMKSAYKEKDGKEPEWTNWSKVKEDEPFRDTLDYIFMSDDWAVDSVVKLPDSKDMVGPLPIAQEPSDHLLLSATLSMKN
eukprot:CAMPEP_0119053312 /NCGR_PEP_ID=MMETSP1177-20130426/74351_1 /TAXON_ID=2985 /ORGANISM="Ochromonas sp, Strain CCMP1899" /LENGTH=201 /DNA_ID=CAMNT_0007033235 /DNA_START=620 /DNA_END=1225 /DNA_ORIENTATION=+